MCFGNPASSPHEDALFVLMASGATRESSVSPAHEEVYQSPGASQEENLDHLLAQYGGYGDKVEAEGEGEMGEGEGTDSGKGGLEVSRGVQVRDAAASERSPPAAPAPLVNQSIIVAPLPHITRRKIHTHTSTPSPRHVASAPASHHATPAHKSKSQSPQRETSQTGQTGDVRSFSWDNLASRESLTSDSEWL